MESSKWISPDRRCIITDISTIASDGDKDAEFYILHSIALDPRKLAVVSDSLKESSFFWYEPHAAIYKAILALSSENLPIDSKSLQMSLEAMGRWEQIGYIIPQLYDQMVGQNAYAGYSLESAVKSVEKKFRRRTMMNQFYQWYLALMRATVDPEDVETDMYKFLTEYNGRFSQVFYPADEAVRTATPKLETMLQRLNNGGVCGLQTGLASLDELLGGLTDDDLHIIGARPSMGKTAMLVRILINLSLKEHRMIGVFSIEMSLQQILLRTAAGHGRINLHSIRTGKADEKETERLWQSLSELSMGKFCIDATPGIDIDTLRQRARRMHYEYGIQALLIDYVGKITCRNRLNRREEVGLIVRELKDLARELHIPVIALSQLNRANETRADKRPGLADLRESGDIEQEASTVVFIHRPEQYGITHFDDGHETECLAELIVAKNREGLTGRTRVRWIPEFATFANPVLTDGRTVLHDPDGYSEPGRHTEHVRYSGSDKYTEEAPF